MDISIEKNLGGTGDGSEVTESHHISEEEHAHSNWEGEGGNCGARPTHYNGDQGDESDHKEEGVVAGKEGGTNTGDGSFRDVTPTSEPQRLDAISPAAQELLSKLSILVWNDGFALVGGVIPMKKDPATGNFIIDSARETGHFNNIGDPNESQSAGLLMTLAMEAAARNGSLETTFGTMDRGAAQA